MNIEAAMALKAAGTSEGAIKGWDARGRGEKVVKTAMKNGYRQSHSFKDAGDTFKVLSHSNTGHSLYVSNDGSWQHKRVEPSMTYSDADYRSSGYRQSEINKIRQDERRVPESRSGMGEKELQGFLKGLYR